MNAAQKTFKSQRSVTIAVNKADRAYGEALTTREDENGRPYRDENAMKETLEFLKAVVANAEKQGFRANSSWLRHYRHSAMMNATGNSY